MTVVDPLRCSECGAHGATVITPKGCFACGAVQPTPSDAAAVRGWRVEQYRSRFVVCDGPLEVWGTDWAARFNETADAERFADAMNEWESGKPQPSNFGNNSWA